MKTKRLAFWLLLSVFVCAAAWWCLTFPYQPDRLWRAMPPDAVLLSDHAAPAARWETVAANPALRSLLAGCGMRAEQIDALARDPDLGQWIRRLAGRRVFLGFTSSLAHPGQPAWVAAGWGGWHAQRLRWMLSLGLVPGVERVAGTSPVPCWSMRPAQEPGSPWLSFAPFEGMVLACLSADRAGVRHLVDMASAGKEAHSERLFSECPPPPGEWSDRCWLRWPMGPAASIRPGVSSLSLRLDATNSLSGRLQWPHGTALPVVRMQRARRGAAGLPLILRGPVPNVPRGGGPAEDALMGFDRLERILGDAPEAFALLPFSHVEPLLSSPGSGAVLRIMAEALSGGIPSGSPAFACLLGDAYSGRMLGVKVPSVVVGVRTGDGSGWLGVVTAMLDELNGRLGAGLIPRREETAEGKTLLVVDATRGEICGSLDRRERPACAVEEGWLLCCSSMDVLSRLLAGAGDEAGGRKTAGTGGSGPARWRRRLDGTAGGYLWMDIASAGLALRKVIAACSLVLMVQDREGSAAVREQLGRLGAVMDALGPLGTCTAWVQFAETGIDVRFRLGEQGAGDDGG